MYIFKRICLSIFLFLLLPVFLNKVFATTFDLIAPDGQLKRGDNVQFTIYIDTEGATVTTSQIGVTFDTQFLQFLSATPGAAMNSVVATTQGDKNLLISGTNSSGFLGKNVFAYITFRITANAAGSATLCSLFNPSPSPNVTAAPRPTALPRTGDTNPKDYASLIGSVIIIGAGGFLLLGKIIGL